MRGLGLAVLPGALAVACLLPSGAAAREVVTLHHEWMSVRAQPGDHADRLKVDVDRSHESLVVNGDLTPPYPTACVVLDGHSTLRCRLEPPVVLLRVNTGGGDDRVVIGRPAVDRDGHVAGEVWRARIDTGAGRDRVISGAVSDAVRLGPESDAARIDVSETDSVLGGAGDDLIEGGPGYGDRLDGGPGEDVLRTAAGGGEAVGSGGIDLIYGGGGSDTLKGGSGDDRLYGAGDEDFIEGGSGADHLLGGAGYDLIGGGFGNDLLFGGPGPDLMNGGPGRHDRCTLGPGTRTQLEGCELSF